MDELVLAAMKRWPDVPDVYGWLSLNEHGRWHLHPAGNASDGDRGETISNPQILRFIDQNYACDPLGRWFFQNGPQRVYVRLDAAPFIVHTEGPGTERLFTHNGLAVSHIDTMLLDETGRLYLNTDLGPALVAGRDAPQLFEALKDADGRPFIEQLAGQAHTQEDAALDAWLPPIKPGSLLPVHISFSSCLDAQIPERLGFVRTPSPTDTAANLDIE